MQAVPFSCRQYFSHKNRIMLHENRSDHHKNCIIPYAYPHCTNDHRPNHTDAPSKKPGVLVNTYIVPNLARHANCVSFIP
jgi:hypothetical protein